MKKVLYLLLLLLVTACSETPKSAENSFSAINAYHYHSGTAYFSGKLTGTPDGKFPKGITLLGSNIFTDEDVAVEIPVGDDGTFAADVHIPHSLDFYVRTGDYVDGLYFFVGDSVNVTMDLASEKTIVSPGSICYWIYNYKDTIMESYKRTYAGKDNIYKIAREGSIEEVENFCREIAKVTEQHISDVNAGTFALPEDVDPIAAEILKSDAVMMGFNTLLNVRFTYDNRRSVAVYDSVTGGYVPKMNPDFRPLDQEWMDGFLKRNERMLLDNPMAIFSSHIGGIVNLLRFGLFDSYIFYRNDVLLGAKRENSQEYKNYVYDFTLPTDYNAALLKEILPLRADTLYTFGDYLAQVTQNLEKESGISSSCFMSQLCIMQNVFGELDDDDITADQAAAFFAGALPFINHPVAAHHYIQAYRAYVRKNESSGASGNVVADAVLNRIIEPYKGNVLFLDFWNMACGPCRGGMMRQRGLVKKMGAEPVKFLYITEEKYRDDSEKWLDETEIKGEHIYISTDDWNHLQTYLNFSGIPFTCIIDKDGGLHRDKECSDIQNFLK
jgi:thiol-disulfide isomerase/thioredoxin